MYNHNCENVKFNYIPLHKCYICGVCVFFLSSYNIQSLSFAQMLQITSFIRAPPPPPPSYPTLPIVAWIKYDSHAAPHIITLARYWRGESWGCSFLGLFSSPNTACSRPLCVRQQIDVITAIDLKQIHATDNPCLASKIWNTTGALMQNQQTGELISTWNTVHKHDSDPCCCACVMYFKH